MPRKAYLPVTIHDYNFETLIKSERDPNAKLRMLGMSHLQEGATITSTAKMLKVREGTVRDWVKSFAKYGLEGLYDKHRSGRKTRLEPENINSLISDIQTLQKERKGGRVKGLDIIELIERKYNVTYSLNGVYVLLHRIGLSWVSARSKHPRSKMEDQELFKKNFAAC